MKTLPILFFLLFPVFLYADAGGCVVYKAKFVLKNGNSVTASLPLSGYADYAYLNEKTGRNRYCADKAIQQLINRVFYRQSGKLTFDAYTAIYAVKYPANTGKVPVCAFSDAASLVHLHLDSIRYTVFLDAKEAFWSYPEYEFLILDTPTSLRMQQETVAGTGWLNCASEPEPRNPGFTHYFNEYLVLNYQKNVSESALAETLEQIHDAFYKPERLLLSETDPKRRREREKAMQETRATIKAQLRAKGIILVEMYHLC
ncbi:MAG: hypothetical protein J0M29_07705 [Chitinophagales bacterium]|nr:hypothetical protein [Chitinophagales bacterium]